MSTIQLKMTNKKVSTKETWIQYTNPKQVWVHYFNDKKFNALVINYEWLTDQVIGMVKTFLSAGIVVKLIDEYLSVDTLLQPVGWQPRQTKEGKFPHFNYHDSDAHAEVYGILSKLKQNNTKYHMEEFETKDSREYYTTMLNEFHFDVELAMKRLKFYAKRYNLLRSTVHDYTAEEMCRRKLKDTSYIAEDDTTYCSLTDVHEEAMTLTKLYQLEYPRNKYEELINRRHALYLLSMYIDPDMKDLEETYRYYTTPVIK